MRSLEQSKTKSYRTRTNKKKYGSRRTCSFKSNSHSSCLALENINEILRIEDGTKHGEDKISWKVVPKDSCEIYKRRRKRQQEDKSNEENKKSEIDIRKKEKKTPRKRVPRKRTRFSRKSKSGSKYSKRSYDTMSTSSCNSASSETSSHTSVEYFD